MEEILYIKVEQNIPVQKRELKFKDIAVLYCTNKNIVQTLEKETFYTLPKEAGQKSIFTIEKVYQGIHKIFPNLAIENLGEQDFIIDYEHPDDREKGKTVEYVKTLLVALVVFFGAAFTIMTFNEDVSVSAVFDKVYELVMGTEKTGGSILELAYALGLPIGILVFYNHFRRCKIKNDPTPIQVEMNNYEEQVNKTIIKTASREGKTIDVD